MKLCILAISVAIGLYSNPLFAYKNSDKEKSKIEKVTEKYNTYNIKSLEEKKVYDDIISRLALLDEKEDERSYNFFTFSNDGKIFNQKTISFIDENFSRNNYTQDQIHLLNNINNEIGGELMRIKKEKNNIRRKIMIQDLFSSLNKHYQDNYLKEISDIKFYNSVQIDSITNYNFKEKELKIIFSSNPKNNKISLYCNDNIKIGYIYGNRFSETLGNIYRINQNHPIVLQLPEEIISQLEYNEKGECIIKKKFKNHDEAIAYYDILKNPRSRFISHFTINEKQKNDTFYFEGKISKFGLYQDNYGLSSPYEVMSGEKYDGYTAVEKVNNTIKNLNFFNYGDNFLLKNEYRNDLFYPLGNYNIRLDEEEGIAEIKTEKVNITYDIIKQDHYYKLKLKKIYKLNSQNIPRTVYIRKLYGNIDAFIDYTFSFETKAFTIGKKGKEIY